MPRWNTSKIRDDDTWAEVRRGWEQGETGASLARWYDVGLANLWRRRASDGWSREKHRPADPQLEPLEGWDLLVRRARRPFGTGRPDAAWAERRLRAFEIEREEQRLLALSLVEMLERDTLDGAPMTAPTWHIGWLMAERARRRPDRAEADRAKRPKGRA